MQKVYIHNCCYACEQIVAYIHERKIPCEIINLSETNENPPFPILIFPALTINDRLVAYGLDIKKRLNPRNKKCASL
ncbi:MAG: hypothetical protein D6707_01730 [Bacteroidetes bacterium]|jgi:hypothetical protein|nr:MAG: hypothetical protein D6707_01730 [Bacteroidota bacterium]